MDEHSKTAHGGKTAPFRALEDRGAPWLVHHVDDRGVARQRFDRK